MIAKPIAILIIAIFVTDAVNDSVPESVILLEIYLAMFTRASLEQI